MADDYDYEDDPAPRFDDAGLGLDSDIDAPFLTYSQMQERQPSTSRSTTSKLTASSQASYQPQLSHVKPTNNAPSLSARPQQGQWEGFQAVQELQQQNAALLRELDLRKQQVDSLGKLLDDSRRSTAVIAEASAPIADPGQKIQALAKKNRELTALLSAEQGRAKKCAEQVTQLEVNVATLQDEVERLKRKEKKLEAKLARATSMSTEPTDGPLMSPTRFATSHHQFDSPLSSIPEGALSSASQRGEQGERAEMVALRNQIQGLKRELHLAQRALVKEVGEEVTPAQILSNESTWKGRAEQIAILKAKLAERAEKDQYSTAISSTSTAAAQSDQRNKQALRKVEQERRAQAEQVAEELRLVKEEAAQLKSKLDSTKARNQSLSHECKDLKERLEAAAEKDKRDQALIESLNMQLNSTGNRAAAQQSTLASELQTTRSELQKFQTLCATQHDAIGKMEKQVDELENARRTQRRQHERDLEHIKDQHRSDQFQRDEELHTLRLQTKQLQQEMERIQLQSTLQQQQLQQQVEQLMQQSGASSQSHTASQQRNTQHTKTSKPPTSSSHRAQSPLTLPPIHKVPRPLSSSRSVSNSTIANRPAVSAPTSSNSAVTHGTVPGTLGHTQPTAGASAPSTATSRPTSNTPRKRQPDGAKANENTSPASTMSRSSSAHTSNAMPAPAATTSTTASSAAATSTIDTIRLHELDALLKVTEAEKQKQGELVELLRKQVAERQAQVEQLDALARSQKRMIHKETTKVEGVHSADPSQRVLELETKLAVQEDENGALKESFRATVKAKEEEIKVLVKMMTETRRVFAEALKAYKQQTSASIPPNSMQAAAQQPGPRSSAQPSK